MYASVSCLFIMYKFIICFLLWNFFCIITFHIRHTNVLICLWFKNLKERLFSYLTCGKFQLIYRPGLFASFTLYCNYEQTLFIVAFDHFYILQSHVYKTKRSKMVRATFAARTKWHWKFQYDSSRIDCAFRIALFNC